MTHVYVCVCVCVHSQSCLTLCDFMNCSLPSSSVHGILQVRILEWVVMPSSRGSSQLRDRACVSYVSCIGRQILYHQCHWGLHVQDRVFLLLLLSHFSHVRLCATPQTAANQALPSLGFSRQEHWSGLPFPSPMHETEK